MGITDYISRHPAFEAQKPDDYEEKFVVNRIKDINRQIGTGYYPALNQLIRNKAEEEIIAELEQDNYVIDENEIREHVNKRAKEIDRQLTTHW